MKVLAFLAHSTKEVSIFSLSAIHPSVICRTEKSACLPDCESNISSNGVGLLLELVHPSEPNAFANSVKYLSYSCIVSSLSVTRGTFLIRSSSASADDLLSNTELIPDNPDILLTPLPA